MADELITIATAPASIVLWKFGEWLIAARLKKAEKQEEATEAEEKSKLDELLKAVQKIERDLALIGRDLNMHAGAVAKIEDRINGISKNHGERISELEQAVAELRALVTQLLNPRRRSK